MRAHVVALALALAGCAGMDESKEHPAPLNLWPDTENGLAEQVEKWAARWAVATGLTVTVGTGGTPVMFKDELWTNGVEDCGVTNSRTVNGMWHSTQSVFISRSIPDGCPTWQYTLGHELGHAVSACDHADYEADVLMSAGLSSKPHWIDAESLAAVCLTVDCAEFNPESGAP